MRGDRVYVGGGLTGVLGCSQRDTREEGSRASPLSPGLSGGSVLTVTVTPGTGAAFCFGSCWWSVWPPLRADELCNYHLDTRSLSPCHSSVEIISEQRALFSRGHPGAVNVSGLREALNLLRRRLPLRDHILVACKINPSVNVTTLVLECTSVEV